MKKITNNFLISLILKYPWNEDIVNSLMMDIHQSRSCPRSVLAQISKGFRKIETITYI